MKNLAGKVFLLALFPFLLMVAVNYSYDPANLFDSGNKYERTVANYLNQGLNVTNISNMDERKFQQFFIEGMKQPPDVIVFGSSNSMYIDSDFFPGERVINNSVSAATFNDFLAIYDLYEKKGFKPKKVILGICPEMLNYAENQFWVSLEDNYNSMSGKIGLAPEKKQNSKAGQTITKWRELISLSYFQQSVNRALNNAEIEATKEKLNHSATRIVDGSFNNGDFYTSKSKENIENTVKRLINKPVIELENFSQPNPVKTEILEHFVAYLQKQHVEVVFYLMEYHPVYYNYVSKRYPVLANLENYLLTYAKQKEIKVYGQNNPYNCNLTNSDFTDYCHLFKPSLLKLFH